MYKINNLGETLSYMIRLDAYHQQSLFFSYKRTKQQTLRIMKINTDCGVIVPIITNQCGVALFRKLKTAGKARLLVFSTCLSSVLHSVYFKFINIFKNRQEYCCKTFWCPSVSFTDKMPQEVFLLRRTHGVSDLRSQYKRLRSLVVCLILSLRLST